MPWASRRCWKRPLNSEPLSERMKRGRFWQPLTQRVKGDGSWLDWAAKAIAKREWGSMKVNWWRQSIAQAHHGIADEHFKRLMFEAFGLAGFAFAGDGFVAAAGTQSDGGVAHFVRVAGDDAADGGDAGQCDVLLPAPRSQQDLQFGFAEVGELLAQLTDLPHQHRCCGCRRCLGAQGLAVRAAGVAAGLAHCFQRYRILRLTSKASQAAAVPCWLKKPRILRRC